MKDDLDEYELACRLAAARISNGQRQAMPGDRTWVTPSARLSFPVELLSSDNKDVLSAIIDSEEELFLEKVKQAFQKLRNDLKL